MSPSRRQVTIALAVLVAVAAIGVAAYALRTQLVGVPLVGRFFHAEGDESAHADYWTCVMHPHIRAHGPGQCPECGMDLVPAVEARRMAAEKKRAAEAEGVARTSQALPAPVGQDPRAEVQLDMRRQQLIGVRTIPVRRSSLARTIRSVGVVRYDETRLTDINLKLQGWIRTLHVNYTGQFVRKGDPLLTIYSPDLLNTQNEYLLALKSREQLQHSQVEDARDYADRLVSAARQRLLLWDLPADQLKKLDETHLAQAEVVFRSPVTGHVLEKQALQGMQVMPGQTLYRVANLSVVWVEADVYEQDFRSARVGQHATVTVDAYPGEQFHGRVVYVYPYVEERTRTVKVRLAFPNPQGRLKPGMYANTELTIPAGSGLTIPSDAVLDSGTRQHVFVALGDGYFEPRVVKVGQRLPDGVEVLEGLKGGESVAAGATFFLDSESQLRASLQAYEPNTSSAPTPNAQLPTRNAGLPAERVTLTLRTQPEPPRSGDNALEVKATASDGSPVTDADVAVAFFMPAMPSMNMPAMRTEAKLRHTGSGVYRGTGQIMTPGRWDVNVTATRQGQRLVNRQLTVVAR